MSALIPSGNATGTGTMTLLAPPTNGTQTVTIPDATGTMMVSGNMPAFSAYYSGGGQSISSSIWTKVTFNTEEFDTNNNYDNATNYRFTPTVAGYYQINLAIESGANNQMIVGIYKNGSLAKRVFPSAANNTYGLEVSALIYCNGSSDYLEGFIYMNSAGTVAGGSDRTFFQAAMVRSA